MTRVWDCFMLRDELDMLQMRLEELDESPVYRHVLVEATADHQGHPKPLHYAENRERFAPWADRIIHVIADDLPDSPDPWVREHAQRDRALTALADAGRDDRVLAADIDEIPSRSALETNAKAPVALEQHVYVFAVDWYAFTERTSVLATAAYARHGGLAGLRGIRGSIPAVKDAGWHFSWLGGREKCLEKLEAFCHLEARDVVRRGIESGDFIERGLWNVTTLTPAAVDGSWPAMIRDRRCPPSWWRPEPDRSGKAP